MDDTGKLIQSGFDAISGAMQRLYPDQKGFYYRTIIPPLGVRSGPLDGVEVWKSEKGAPHWHYVTYGFTELYNKKNNNLNKSCVGFELTFRLKREGEAQPPVWPIKLLQNLARLILDGSHVFAPGHHMSANSPITLHSSTQLTAFGFRHDPELAEQDTPNGRMTFLQVVGLTKDEMDAMMCWHGERFLAELERYTPFCITDLSRTSVMTSPFFCKIWKEGMERDGSSTTSLYIDELGFRLENNLAHLRLGAVHATILARMLRARVGKGRSLILQSHDQTILFRPGTYARIHSENNTPVLTLPADVLKELCAVLQPRTGQNVMTSLPLAVTLLPSKIIDLRKNITIIH